MNSEAIFYKEPCQEQKVGEGRITHDHESDRNHHHLRRVNEENEKNDVDVFLRTVNEVLKGTEFWGGGGALIL